MIELSNVPDVEVITGYTAKFIHTESMTLGFWEVKKGAVMPVHKHLHEQVSQVDEGAFEFTINGETKIFTKGMIAVIPPYIEHGGVALTDCKLFDIFQPVREDYRNLG